MKISFDEALAPRAEEMRRALAERRGDAVADGAMALIHLHKIQQYLVMRADFDPVDDAEIVETLRFSLPHCMSVLTETIGVTVAELELIHKACEIDR